MDVETLAFFYVLAFIVPSVVFEICILGHYLIKYLIDLLKNK